ncbi:MAG: hypothetical protein LIP08_06130 [Bacteroides sp.]|nr:hypothetical protein [Bacteroides sp.]
MYNKKYTCALLICIGLLAFVCSCGRAPVTETDRRLEELDKILEQRPDYIVRKERRLDSLRTLYAALLSPQETYVLINELLDEYQAYRYDSAYVYAERGVGLALEMGSDERISHSLLRQAYILCTGGLYNEALDILQSLDPLAMDRVLQIEYYSRYEQVYYNLTQYTSQYPYSTYYINRSSAYLDTIISLTPRSRRSISMPWHGGIAPREGWTSRP